MVIKMNLALLLGGVILFIYAIDLLTNDLLKLSIDKIKEKLYKFTSSLHSSLLTGFLSTALIQSSSAIIMLTIALINANILTFNQSIGIVLGSNIATTLTSFIVGLNIEKYASLIMLISLIFTYNKNAKIARYAKISFSISLLFFSIFLMSESTLSIQENPKIYTFINKIASNYLLSLLIGILLTASLQSSSVFIAIIQILAMSGFISLYQAIPLIFGANIGTSFDALITIFSSNKESKKLAHFSILFNLITVILFSILISPFTFILDFFSSLLNANIAINIALINILFNLLGVLLTIPFINKIKRYYAKW
jgi:phosphate:Na+ symporter